MYRVPPDRAWWPAVGAPLERGVRPHSLRGGRILFTSSAEMLAYGSDGAVAVLRVCGEGVRAGRVAPCTALNAHLLIDLS
jgi:hypothetical protein